MTEKGAAGLPEVCEASNAVTREITKLSGGSLFWRYFIFPSRKWQAMMLGLGFKLFASQLPLRYDSTESTPSLEVPRTVRGTFMLGRGCPGTRCTCTHEVTTVLLYNYNATITVRHTWRTYSVWPGRYLNQGSWDERFALYNLLHDRGP